MHEMSTALAWQGRQAGHLPQNQPSSGAKARRSG